jgi:hypothetical protein
MRRLKPAVEAMVLSSLALYAGLGIVLATRYGVMVLCLVIAIVLLTELGISAAQQISLKDGLLSSGLAVLSVQIGYAFMLFLEGAARNLPPRSR